MQSVSKNINEARDAFVNTELLDERIRDDKVAGWNNIVKECCQISHAGRKFMLVQTTLKEPDQQFFLVDEAKLQPTVLKYLHAYVEEYSDQEFAGEVISKDLDQMDKDPEVEKLKALLQDLRKECVELAAELA